MLLLTQRKEIPSGASSTAERSQYVPRAKHEGLSSPHSEWSFVTDPLMRHWQRFRSLQERNPAEIGEKAGPTHWHQGVNMMVEDFLHCVEMQHSTSGATMLKPNYHKTKHLHLFGQQLVAQNHFQPF